MRKLMSEPTMEGRLPLARGRRRRRVGGALLTLMSAPAGVFDMPCWSGPRPFEKFSCRDLQSV